MSKKIKVLEYELKKKINDSGILAKLFKSKNSNDSAQIDLYV
jgi:hypothetical protein